MANRIIVSLADPCDERGGGLGRGSGLGVAEEIVVGVGLGPEPDEVSVGLLPRATLDADVRFVEIAVVPVLADGRKAARARRKRTRP